MPVDITNALQSQLQAQLQNLPESEPLWVGFSGGLDSSVLLHALINVAQGRAVTAVHVHHGLSASADSWMAHCRAKACEWGAGFKVVHVEVKPAGKGLEDAAREARFSVFAQTLQLGGTLFTGHHQNDQAETVLLRLLRGTGVRGLGSIQATRPFGQGRLVRPWLSVPRDDLLSYARQNQLTWIEDDSNTDQQLDRNYLRLTIMPAVLARWPGALKTLSRAATLAQENESLVALLAEQDLQGLDARAERIGHSIALDSLADWPKARVANVLRYWLHSLNISVPSKEVLDQVYEQVFGPGKAPDSQPNIAWASYAWCYFHGRLYCLPRGDAPSQPFQLGWSGKEALTLPNGGTLALLKGGDFYWDGQPLEVRSRLTGERCHPRARKHSQTLKKLLQEYQLEPWLRDQVPIVLQGGRAVAVGDLWLEGDAHAQHEEGGDAKPGYRFVWRAPKVAGKV